MRMKKISVRLKLPSLPSKRGGWKTTNNDTSDHDAAGCGSRKGGAPTSTTDHRQNGSIVSGSARLTARSTGIASAMSLNVSKVPSALDVGELLHNGSNNNMICKGDGVDFDESREEEEEDSDGEEDCITGEIIGGNDNSSSSEEDEDYDPRGVRMRGRFNDSDSEESDSESGLSDEDLENLPSGYLEFLSCQQDDVDDELSIISDQLRGVNRSERRLGVGGDRTNSSSAPLTEIHFVRENIHDKGAVRVAHAMAEGQASCPLNYSRASSHSLQVFGSSGDEDCMDDTTGGMGRPSPPPLPCLCPSRNLTEITLSQCHIGDEGASAIASALSSSCNTLSLKTLDLSSNDITGVGVTNLAKCTVMSSCESVGSTRGTLTARPLPPGCSIDTLVLSVNRIGSVGVLALASALQGYHYSGCNQQPQQQECDTTQSTLGCCSLKTLQLCGCQLNDDDAIVLGESLLPHQQYSKSSSQLSSLVGDDAALPSMPPRNGLMHLDLNRNRITTRGMEFLYSVIHQNGGGGSQCTGDSDYTNYNSMHSMQSLYCQSNHTIELGLTVDYGTRDYNFGIFFDQEEDEQLLKKLRQCEVASRSESTTTTLAHNVEHLKHLMMRKWMLKEKIMKDLLINKQCLSAIEKMTPSTTATKKCTKGTSLALSTIYEDAKPVPNREKEQRKRILWAAAQTKVTQEIQTMVRLTPIALPRRQDDSGERIDNDDYLGLKELMDEENSGVTSTSIGECFHGIDLNVFPRNFAWMNQRFDRPTALAIVFDSLRNNADLCGFHSGHTNMLSQEVTHCEEQ